jgi:predicted nucleic acid-binding protein
MKLIVQDANVIFDLIDCAIFELFFSLELEVITTSLVLDEINQPAQKKACQAVIRKELLNVVEISTIEYLRLNALDLPGLKVADRSVLKLAKTRQATLLTGDGKLRRTAKELNVEVCGTLWIFDQLVKSELISQADAHVKLMHLREVNQRLPQKEIEKRLKAWS